MRIFKFNIKEEVYTQFISICKEQDITVKKKINVLLSQDKANSSEINSFFPENTDIELRSITLKVNEELYKGIMKKSDILGIKPKKYIPYLIYRFIGKV